MRMSVKFYREPNGGLVFKPSGMMESEEIHSAHVEMYQKCGNEFNYLLVNLLEADGSRLSSADMKQLADRDCDALKNNPHSRIAIVTRSAYVGAMNEIYKDYTGCFRNGVRIFDSMVIARAWLEE